VDGVCAYPHEGYEESCETGARMEA